MKKPLGTFHSVDHSSPAQVSIENLTWSAPLSDNSSKQVGISVEDLTEALRPLVVPPVPYDEAPLRRYVERLHAQMIEMQQASADKAVPCQHDLETPELDLAPLQACLEKIASSLEEMAENCETTPAPSSTYGYWLYGILPFFGIASIYGFLLLLAYFRHNVGLP